MKIKMTMKAVDGCTETKTYKTVKGARAFADKWLGEYYDIGSSYAVSGDGISTVYCTGITLKELMSNPKEETKETPDTVSDNNNHKNGEEKMTEKKLEMTENFIVGSRDGVLHIGSLKKAKPAQPAVEAVAGVKAVEAVEAVKADKKAGIEAVEAVAAVKAVKAVKASPAIEATKAVQQVHLNLVSQEVADEVRARMADQGFADKFDGQTIMHNEFFRLTYEAETDKPIRAAFKKCKSKDGYNAPGLAILAEKAKAEAKAQKDAEKAKKDADKDAAKASEAAAAAEKPVEKPVDENGVTDEWPED